MYRKNKVHFTWNIAGCGPPAPHGVFDRAVRPLLPTVLRGLCDGKRTPLSSTTCQTPPSGQRSVWFAPDTQTKPIWTVVWICAAS
jgi:hypothetical protein